MVEGAQEPTGESGRGVRGSSSKTRAGVISPGGKHHPRVSHTAWSIVQGRHPGPNGRASRLKSHSQGRPED